MTLAPLLQLRDLTVTIRTPRGEVPVVRGVSFDLHAGRTHALVGESGSGKTMTATSLLGLGPPGTTLILAGVAAFDGRDPLAMPEREIRALRAPRAQLHGPGLRPCSMRSGWRRCRALPGAIPTSCPGDSSNAA